MSSYLHKYLDLGLSDIVVVEHNWREETGGYQDEHITELVAARKAKKYVTVEVRETIKFGWNAGRSDSITEHQITEKEYLRLAKGKTFIDTPAARQKVQEERERAKRKHQLEKELRRLAPECPACNVTMTHRSGSRGPFWGCPRYPKCERTKSMSPNARKVNEQWAEI